MSNFDPNRWGNNYGQQPLPPYVAQPQPYGYQQPYNPLTNGIIRPQEGGKGFGLTALILAIVNLIPAIILIVFCFILISNPNSFSVENNAAFEAGASIYLILTFSVVPIAGIVGIIFAILSIAQRKGRIYGIWSIVIGSIALITYVLPFVLLYAVLAQLGSY